MYIAYTTYMKKPIIAVVTILTTALIMSSLALCIIFPNKYVGEIKAAAEEFGLSRALVKSVVWAESGFNPKATSHKGAKGLMQLMPETFEMCASVLGIKGADIYDVNTSLRCGCYYLSVMLDKFDVDETAALMAYNAGEKNARRFLDGEEMFPETKNYISRISRAKKVYGFILT